MEASQKFISFAGMTCGAFNFCERVSCLTNEAFNFLAKPGLKKKPKIGQNPGSPKEPPIEETLFVSMILKAICVT